MTCVGIYLEVKDGQLKKTGLELLTLVRQAGREAWAVVFADEAGDWVETLKQYGARRILLVSGLGSQSFHPELYARRLASLIQELKIPDFVCAHSVQGKDLLPRVAARLEAPLATDCTAIDFEKGIATRPMYSAKVIAQVALTGPARLYTLRPNSITPEAAPAKVEAEIQTLSATRETTLAEIKDVVRGLAKRIDLTEARVIVSGGRGMKNSENFKILEELAQKLGAAVGASRAAVDSGFVPQDMQVGQTGKTVNPELYIACGISGAIQHFAGMKTSKVIVAINKDPDAPIFQKADYGIVGDLFEVVPLLTQELDKVLKKD